MKTNEMTPKKIAEEKASIERHILWSLAESATFIEKALIEALFVSIIHSETVIDTDNIDQLHLLYGILQDAKKLNKLNELQESIQESVTA